MKWKPQQWGFFNCNEMSKLSNKLAEARWNFENRHLMRMFISVHDSNYKQAHALLFDELINRQKDAKDERFIQFLDRISEYENQAEKKINALQTLVASLEDLINVKDTIMNAAYQQQSNLLFEIIADLDNNKTIDIDLLLDKILTIDNKINLKAQN